MAVIDYRDVFHMSKSDERIIAKHSSRGFRSIERRFAWVAGGSPAVRTLLDFGVIFRIGDKPTGPRKQSLHPHLGEWFAAGITNRENALLASTDSSLVSCAPVCDLSPALSVLYKHRN
jgi:hypothetical protein